jgi:hypothetical protein
MTSMLKRFLVALLASMAFALPASATSFSTDYTDLWFIPAESGWGVNLIQQGDIIFATLFVYGTDQTPRWYTASRLAASNASNFSGPLYRTTGPYFGAGWTGGGPAVQVGTMSFSFTSPQTATLSYTIDGVAVTKQVQRQTWTANSLAGKFQGGLTATSTGCASGINNPILVFDRLTVTHSAANQVSMTVEFFTGNGTASTCTFNGNYTQAGKMGNVAGSWSCSTGNTGNFSVSQVDVAITGWTGRFAGNDQFCTYNGYFGGVRDIL